MGGRRRHVFARPPSSTSSLFDASSTRVVAPSAPGVPPRPPADSGRVHVVWCYGHEGGGEPRAAARVVRGAAPVTSRYRYARDRGADHRRHLFGRPFGRERTARRPRARVKPPGFPATRAAAGRRGFAWRGRGGGGRVSTAASSSSPTPTLPTRCSRCAARPHRARGSAQHTVRRHRCRSRATRTPRSYCRRPRKFSP